MSIDRFKNLSPEDDQNHGVNPGVNLLVCTTESRYGNVCATFVQHSIPFSHAGNLTIAISEPVFEQLPDELRLLIEYWEREGELDIKPLYRHPVKRRIPTPEQTREALRKLIPKEFLRDT